MEESPHKCPVCNRSFNQRSNLKTHLLTHTDHKPYECNACGKVFRRNCDLRRHALTHSVGDVPGAEPLDPNSLDDHHDTLSGDEDDTVVEVDSPIHSPLNAPRTPSPVQVADDLNEEDEEEHIDTVSPVTPAPLSEKEHNEITHCHHERSNGSKSPYTMRPQNHYERDHRFPSSSNMSDYLPFNQEVPLSLKIHTQISSSARSDGFVPMLHVRRDLHQKINKPSTVTSGSMEPPSNFLNVPIRKRIMGPDGEPQLPMIGRQMFYSLHRQHSLGKPPDELIMTPMLASPDSQSQDQVPLPSTSSAIPLLGPASVASLTVPPAQYLPALQPVQIQLGSTSLSSGESQSSGPSPPAPSNPPAPPKRTGFSIEDIMRR